MTSLSIPQDTIYMFSCDQCHANQSIGSLPANNRLVPVANSVGTFHCFILKIGDLSEEVSKGSYGYTPERSIFPLSKEESETIFGIHVCPKALLENEQKTSVQKNPIHRIALTKLDARDRGERGAVPLPDDGKSYKRAPKKYGTI